MKARFGVRERLWLGGSAFAALVGAHALTFFLAAPDHSDRADLLHASGHGSWTNISIMAGALFIGALVAFGNRWASPVNRDVPLLRLFGHSISRLLPLQVVGFVALESSERFFAGGSPWAALSEPLVLLGVALQVAAALACGLLLVAFTRLVRTLLTTGPRRKRHARVMALRTPARAPFSPQPVARLAWNLRGPPPSLRSR